MTLVIRSHDSQEVRDAAKAIVMGKADDAAYRVAEAAGIHELAYGIIYRERDQMDATTAREIIKQAKKDDVYGGPVPEDDASALHEAQALVEMAEQAWASFVRGPEVSAILKLAEGAKNGDGQESPPEPTEPKETIEEAPKQETPRERPRPTEQKKAEQKPEPEEHPLARVEPWTGYAEDRVRDIIEGVSIGVVSEENPVELLRHIWIYEQTHKKRVRIFNAIRQLAEEHDLDLGGLDENQEEAPSAESEGAEATESGEGGKPEAEQGEEAEPETPEGPTDGGVSDGEQEPQEGDREGNVGDSDGDSGQESDASAEPEGEAGESGAEDRSGEDEAPEGGGSDGGGHERAYRELTDLVEREIQGERIHIPEPPTEAIPELPWRWAEISSQQLQDFHMQFAALAYYKSFVLTRHERMAMHCKAAGDEMARELMLATEKYDDHGKEKRVAILEAEIESDPAVRAWRRHQRKHDLMAASAKSERDGYSKLVEALSRLETMRHNDFERSRR